MPAPRPDLPAPTVESAAPTVESAAPTVQSAARGGRHIALVLAFTAAAARLAWGVLRPAPLGPDDPAPRVLAAFCFFVFWLCACLAWGAVLSALLRVQKHRALAAICFGSGGAALTAMALGHAGLVGYANGPLLETLLALGLVLNLLRRDAPRDGPRAPASTAEVAVACAIAATVALRALRALAPQGHPDALYYHLVGPRLWADAGRIYLPGGLPIVYHCGSWEALVLWGQTLLGGPGGGGLIEGQLFAQWLHALFAATGCALALGALLQPFSRTRGWLWLAALAGTCAASQCWPAWNAKNDWGASLWVLGGFGLLFEGAAPVAACCALLGLGFAAKPTAALAALPLGLLWLWWRPPPARAVLAGLAGFAAAAAPIAVRNALAVRDPFFPALDRVFHSPALSGSWRRHLEDVGKLDPATIGATAALLFRQSPLVLTLLLAPLAWLLRREIPKLAPLVVATLGALLLFVATAGPESSLRLFGPGSMLVCATAVLAVEDLTHRAPRLRWPAWGATGVAVLAFAGLPIRALPQALAQPVSSELLRTSGPQTPYAHAGGDAMAWLRLHADPGELVALPTDDRVYYLSGLRFVSIPEVPALDRAFDSIERTDELVAALRKLGARWVLDLPSWRREQPNRLLPLLADLERRAPQAVAFRGAQAKVIDLARAP